MYNQFSTLIVTPILAWLTTLSLVVVAYLVSLQIKEFKRSRRLEAERERLGL